MGHVKGLAQAQEQPAAQQYRNHEGFVKDEHWCTEQATYAAYLSLLLLTIDGEDDLSSWPADTTCCSTQHVMCELMWVMLVSLQMGAGHSMYAADAVLHLSICMHAVLPELVARCNTQQLHTSQ